MGDLHRTNCIVCNNEELGLVVSYPAFPIMAISNEKAVEYFFDLNLLFCHKCNCLQLENLVDPKILYSELYTNATFSPSWKNHNEFLSKFILDSTRENTFLEVGANKGGLYTMLKNKRNIEYSVLDMYRNEELDETIHFMEGNCETFDFTRFRTLILSHVFEHLYSPRTFIENIEKAGVENIFISIPNFDLLLEEKSLSMIHSQHTFFCGFNYMLYMFSMHHYKCKHFLSYTGNFKSTMFHFVLDKTIEPLDLPRTDIQLYKNIYTTKIDYFNSMRIPTNSYIFPSGIYGQYFYYFLKDKENIVGFLDNNTERHNKKLYGTDKFVYSPLHIDYANSTIIVYDCPYKNEIVDGLMKLSPSVSILYV
jgi:hypothetical protein